MLNYTDMSREITWESHAKHIHWQQSWRELSLTESYSQRRSSDQSH